jgi:elongation factor Tu
MSVVHKPSLRVATLGQIGHGSTTLTGAIGARHRHLGDVRDPVPFDESGSVAISEVAALRLTLRVHYETAGRDYAHEDSPSHGERIRGLITGRLSPDCAILVVSAEEGPTPQTREQVLVAGRVGVPHVVVFLSKCDLVEDEGWLDLVEVETRQLLQLHGYLGDEAPVIRGDALAASESRGGEGCACIDELVRALDAVPLPEREADGPLLMSVEDAFLIRYRGVVATGRVERGDLERGQVLAAPGSVAAHACFEALVFLLPGAEGGPVAPIIGGYLAHLHFRGARVIGECALPVGLECMPGGHVLLTVELLGGRPVAMEAGTRFNVTEASGRTVGNGVVTRPLA